MRFVRLLMALFLTACAAGAWAQEVHTPVYLSDGTEDGQGHRLAYAMKEQIRRSASMRLVDTEKESALQLRLGSIDPGGMNSQTAYSLAVTMTNIASPNSFPLYLDSTGGVCGSLVIDQCANSLVARVDSDLSSLRAAFQSLGK